MQLIGLFYELANERMEYSSEINPATTNQASNTYKQRNHYFPLANHNKL